MNRVKYKKGTSNFGFAGKEYPADKNGEADLPDDALAAAIEFGVLAHADDQPEQKSIGNGSEADEALEAEAKAFEAENAERLAPILKGTVLEVIDELPKLNQQELVLLSKLELLGQGRKGVAEAISEEIENTKDQ